MHFYNVIVTELSSNFHRLVSVYMHVSGFLQEIVCAFNIVTYLFKHYTLKTKELNQQFKISVSNNTL